jgi:formylglycine-generating enzyme required for sulfatase activity
MGGGFLGPRAFAYLVLTLATIVWATFERPAHGTPNPQAKTATEMQPYVETIPGTPVTFAMTPIPGGTFLMGSPQGEPGRNADEGPQHEVTIRPFWMSTMEVTWDEYDRFLLGEQTKDQALAQKPPAESARAANAADAVTHPSVPYMDESHGYGKGRQPAITMTHHAAMEYCRWLSSKTGKTYRLPTEAEWEYACRAGSQTAYSFGDDPKLLGEFAWSFDNSNGAPQPVGKKKPNGWGLHDMHGNVAEYCVDHYDASFYARFKPGAPAVSPVLMPDAHRYPYVVRGGSWDDEAKLLRSAARRATRKEWSRRDPQIPKSIWWHPEASFVGFRVVRPVEEQENLKNLRSTITKKSPD